MAGIITTILAKVVRKDISRGVDLNSSTEGKKVNFISGLTSNIY